MMKYILPENFAEKLQSLPVLVQSKFWKQLKFLLLNLRHSSLRAKKYDETHDIWQARVNHGYRFYFSIDKNFYVLLDIRPHPEK